MEITIKFDTVDELQAILRSLISKPNPIRDDVDKEILDQVKKRDNNKCVKCNSIVRLQVHHLNNYKNFPNERNDIDNLVCLCYACHRNFHNKFGNACTKEDFIIFMSDYKSKYEISINDHILYINKLNNFFGTSLEELSPIIREKDNNKCFCCNTKRKLETVEIYWTDKQLMHRTEIRHHPLNLLTVCKKCIYEVDRIFGVVELWPYELYAKKMYKYRYDLFDLMNKHGLDYNGCHRNIEEPTVLDSNKMIDLFEEWIDDTDRKTGSLLLTTTDKFVSYADLFEYFIDWCNNNNRINYYSFPMFIKKIHYDNHYFNEYFKTKQYYVYIKEREQFLIDNNITYNKDNYGNIIISKTYDNIFDIRYEENDYLNDEDYVPYKSKEGILYVNEPLDYSQYNHFGSLDNYLNYLSSN